MESRKIQKVGAATLTISLPKEWAEQRNLKKGDQVFLVEEGEALKVLPGPAAEERHRAATEFIVDADLCEEPGMLERVIVGNYVLGREKIIVRSALRLRSDHQDEVRGAIRRLMGIGIIGSLLPTELKCVQSLVPLGSSVCRLRQKPRWWRLGKL